MNSQKGGRGNEISGGRRISWRVELVEKHDAVTINHRKACDCSPAEVGMRVYSIEQEEFLNALSHDVNSPFLYFTISLSCIPSGIVVRVAPSWISAIEFDDRKRGELSRKKFLLAGCWALGVFFITTTFPDIRETWWQWIPFIVELSWYFLEFSSELERRVVFPSWL